jgi:hypothetical protein
MKYRERNLGTSVVFLLPSLKLKEPSLNGPSIENRLHAFLMENFGGYTAQAGNIFGYWREENGRDSYGEHREFSVGFDQQLFVRRAGRGSIRDEHGFDRQSESGVGRVPFTDNRAAAIHDGLR